MPPRLLPAFLAAAGLLLAGCFSESKNPLSTPATSTIDPRLEGIYVSPRAKRGDALSAVHFHYRAARAGANGQARTTPWLEMLGIDHTKDGGLKGTTYRALTTRLAGRDYMSIIAIGSNGEKSTPSLYLFARYEIGWSGDLQMWFADPNVLQKAVQTGKLRGEVRHHQFFEDVTLTDSTEHLAAFVAASNPATLFNVKLGVLHRVAH